MFWGKNTKIHGIAKTNPLLYRSIHSEAKQLLKRINLKKTRWIIMYVVGRILGSIFKISTFAMHNSYYFLKSMKIKQNVKNEMVQNNVHVFVMDNFGYRRVSIHDVIYLEASRNYCVIHLVDKSKITVSVPMCEVQEYFSPDLFIRIQRSYIINLEHVSRYIGNFVRMIDDRDITIGRDYQETIRKSFILIGSRKRVIEKRKQKYGG